MKKKAKITKKSVKNKKLAHKNISKSFDVAPYFPIRFSENARVTHFKGFDALPMSGTDWHKKTIMARLMEAYEIHRARHILLPDVIYLKDEDYYAYVAVMGDGKAETTLSMTFRGITVRRSVHALFV
jgi:hypothetical protein